MCCFYINIAVVPMLRKLLVAAFVIYDGRNRRVLAARDKNGSQQLFWGSTVDGCLMFGSEISELSECDPSATAFPAGKQRLKLACSFLCQGYSLCPSACCCMM